MQEPVSRPAGQDDTNRDITVLLVDDDPLLTGVSAEYLESLDDRFRVLAETTAREALELLTTENVDCVVSDFAMPEMDGIEFLTVVREDHGSLPFILLTGKGDERVASEAIAAGVTDYVPKERTTEQYETLTDRIVAAVERHRDDRSATWYRRLVEAGTDAVAVVNSSGVVEWVTGSDGLLGRSPDSIIDTPIFDIVHPEDAPRFRERFFTAVDEPSTDLEVELRARRADGTWVWLAVIGTTLNVDPGTDGVVLALRDISTWKSRTRDLERQVAQLDEFASILSHDLRNPLSVARGRLDLARETCDTDHLGVVADAHDRMDRLIEDLLEFARLGREAVDPQPVELAALVRTSWAEVSRAGTTLDVATDRTIMADPDRTRQLLENLLDNAVSHGGPGVTVTVGDLGGGFFVADDGPGIAEADRSTVFDRGYSTGEDGIGFGLTIVQRIADAHGWTVRVSESAKGGARFEVTGVEVPD